jgi:hypothetical protein
MPPRLGTPEYEEWKDSDQYKLWCKHMSEAQKRRYEDPEERRKNSERQKKRYEDDPTLREKCSKLHTGVKQSDEAKEKKRLANLKRYEDPEERKRTGELTRKRFEDPEQRERQRINQIRVFQENPGLRDIVSKTFKNKKQTKEHAAKHGLGVRGENNGCWKGGITRLDRQIRTSTKMKEWIHAVFERDDYRDWFSGCRGTHKNSMQAHHIIKFSILMEKYKITNLEEAEACEELWDVSNGVTMLRISHRAYHSMWG